jgi:hypothetical protein
MGCKQKMDTQTGYTPHSASPTPACGVLSVRPCTIWTTLPALTTGVQLEAASCPAVQPTMPTNPYLGQLRGCLRIWARGQSTLSQGLQGSQGSGFPKVSPLDWTLSRTAQTTRTGRESRPVKSGSGQMSQSTPDNEKGVVPERGLSA